MEITIYEQANVLVIKPLAPGLEKALTAYRTKREPATRFVGGCPQRYLKTTRDEFPLYIYADDMQVLLCPAGLLPAAQEFCRRAGHSVRYSGGSPVLPPWDATALPELRPGQLEVLEAVARNPRGIIKCATGFGKSFLVTTLCRLWPMRRFLVLSTTSSVCNSIADALLAQLPKGEVYRMFGTHAAKKQAPNCRIIVSTTQSLHKIPREWPQVVLFDEVHGAGSPGISRQLTEFLHCQCFGLSATPLDRTDSLNLLTESIFGQVLVNYSFEEARELGLVSDIQVIAVRCTMPDIQFATDHEAEVFGYWYNHTRNQKLYAKSREVCPNAPVLHYVNRVEHALVLRRSLMPGVPVAQSGITPERAAALIAEGIVTRDEIAELNSIKPAHLERDFRAGKYREVIATGVWKQGTDFPDLACLVRYDGESNTIADTQIGGRGCRIGSDGQKQFCYLIDSADNYGPRFWRRWLKRRKSYKALGWRITEE